MRESLASGLGEELTGRCTELDGPDVPAPSLGLPAFAAGGNIPSELLGVPTRSLGPDGSSRYCLTGETIVLAITMSELFISL